ncbi:ATP-binding cassette sub-family A member 12 [Stegastes partitus]|uniref:ATP-binding cassette sub-family A member 12 n=1 Tax=Stegastes partitus TaxID=144197 RepID=A0A9Y4NFM9_9TELE|nr:PREDICTED: ATP-binding cassette sub-family A member 12 [Stegastes partitus]
MGHTLLTYSDYFHPDDVDRLREAIKPFTNQTSPGVVEAILSAVETLKKMMDAPNGDPTDIILGRKIEYLQSGNLSSAAVTDLHLLSMDFMRLFTPEGLQNLTQAGPDAALDTVIQKLVAFLPPQLQQNATKFLQDFKALQHNMTKCGQNCSAGISEIFKFLDQILDTMLSANGNVTIKIALTNSVREVLEREQIASLVFSLLLPPNEAAYVETFKQTLHFIRLVMATPNVTVSDIQNALRQSNLTVQDLKDISALGGASNINDLMVNMMEIVNVRQCFEPQNDTMKTSQCVQGLIKGVSGFLAQLPALRNHTATLSLIPLMVNETVSDIIQGNFSSSPNKVLANALNSTLDNIKMSLQLNHLDTPEIMKEIAVVERLIQLICNMDPYQNLNSTLMMDPMYAEKVYLKLVGWYLKRLENVTSNSSVSHFLQPFFHMAQIELTLQLAQTNFSAFVTDKIEFLLKTLKYPIDGAGLSKIGQTTIEIFRRYWDITKLNLVTQNELQGFEVFNTTVLNAVEYQMNVYLDCIQTWMKQPNVSLVLNNTLQWGNSSMMPSTLLTDVQGLLNTMANCLSEDEVAYLSKIGNITQALSKALMVAEQPGGLQSEDFQAAMLGAVKKAMQLLTNATAPLPQPVQQNILGIVQDSLTLIVHQNMSFASSRNISLLLLKRMETVIQQMVPETFADYLLSGVMVVTTYFESISEVSGSDSWNQIILNEMKTVQSLLPPNSTAQAYVSVLINITHLILESGQGNMSLWASFENATVENLPKMIGQMWNLFSKVWQLVMGGTPATAPSLKGFTQLVPVIQQVMTGKADQDTWDKFEQMLKALLSALEGAQPLDPSVTPVLEKVIESLVKNMRAENVMILSLQTPVVTLMTEMAQSMNTSHFNLSEASERMQVAIERTVQAAQQANGTLKCREVLRAWEPMREAAGLSNVTMAMWCNISLQPVLESYAAAQAVYSQLNTTHMGVGPISVSAAAARIVKSVQSLYDVSIYRTVVAEKLVMTFFKQLSMLTDLPLSPGAQHYLFKQLQDMQAQNSLSSIKMLSDELLRVAPYLQPYTEAIMKALSHVLENPQRFQNSSSSEKLFEEAAMIFLTSANITSSDIPAMMWGNFTGLNETSLIDTMKDAVKMMIDMKVLGDVPMVYQALEQFLAFNDTSLIVQKVAEMSEWLASTQASGLDLLSQALPRIHDILKPLLSVLAEMSMDMEANVELFENLAENVIAMLQQWVRTGSPLPPMNNRPRIGSDMMGNNRRVRQRREAPVMMMMRDPMDDFIELFNIDYPAMFRALAVTPTTQEVMETVHVFFANPDLGVVLKGATHGMPWGFNASREETVDTALGLLSSLTVPGMLLMPPTDVAANVADMIPEGFPFSTEIKDLIRALANESQDSRILMQQTFQTAAELLKINLTDPQFTEQLGHLKSQVCVLENKDSARLIMETLSIGPGLLCQTLFPLLEVLVESLQMNTSAMSDAVFQTVVGDPMSYNFHANWSSVMSKGLGFNTSSLRSLNINATSPGAMTVGEMLKNKTAFVLDVERHMNFDPAALHLLMNTTLPNNNVEILSWLVNVSHCNTSASAEKNQPDEVILKTFCSMSVTQWYEFSLLTARHVKLEKLVYRFVLSEDMQSVVGVMAKMVQSLTDMMDRILPAFNQLQSYLLSIEDLNFAASNEFKQMTRGQRSTISTQATFVTLSRALCNNGIMALFGISKLPAVSEPSPSFTDNKQREEMIDRFKIPRNATPFCQNMYLDMVNTTGGAIAWAFIKPMLMGEILYTPDTPTTRDIMEKANATLQEFANLRKYSEEWIKSSSYIMDSAKILSHTLPMLQNSLGNSFVKNFIEMQTDINVGRMKETLSNFSNMTLMLEQNKHILKQITTLSTLMVSLSSCVKFDRYRGFDSEDQLNSEAQELAKNRNLYASVIFKLPKDEDSSRKARSTSSLPPRVKYTIRMHMDNVMRTDRVRDPYFVKDTHMQGSTKMRYNRGFVYLQENIDRAIIESQTGRRVTDTAVQIQPFPYPCFLRDEYLEAISFVFPLMLMIAWVLFVAQFVKKLVHERELRLHEYMKMMGVNPLSHFFAWFLECAAYLVLTIVILTLVLKYGNILSNSDGFLIFLYLCDYGLSILAFSYLVSSFFDQTYIAGLSGSLLYILCFFPFIIVMSMETNLTFSQKSLLSLFSPTCFSYASQYASRYEAQGEGIQWSNSYTSPIAGDTASFGWLCWLMLIDSILYFIVGAYIRMVFPGKYGIPAPWYFPFKLSFWADLCSCRKSKSRMSTGLLFTNIMQNNQPVFSDDKGKGTSNLSSTAGENFSELPVGVALHGLSKIYGDKAAIENLNVSFYEGHVTSLLGHNGAGKTTTMSLLTGLFAPTSGTIEVYGRDMQADIDAVRQDLGVCMQYDVLFEHMTSEEHLLLYGQIKAPHWSNTELRQQVRTILEETGMYAHRHKRVGTLSGGMKRKLSISIAFIGGSRLVVLDEPTTGVDPCSRRSIWDIVLQHKKQRTIIMSTHHLDEAEVLSDRIAFLERGGLKCCGSPFYLKDKLGQGYKLTLTKKIQNSESEKIDNAELKAFIQTHVPEARLKEAQGGDLVYSLPPFTSSNASSYRSLLTALDSNLDALQLGGYGISDTTLEEVFLQLTHGNTGAEDGLLSISETVSDTASLDSFHSDHSDSGSGFGDKIELTSPSTVQGMALAWQQVSAILVKRFHHSRRDWKGLMSQILLPVLFVIFAMGLGSIKSDLRHYPEMELSPALYNVGPSYSFFSNQNPRSSHLADTMMSFPGIDNACLDKSDNLVCTRNTNSWSSRGNSSSTFNVCKCTEKEQVCDVNKHQPPHRRIPSSQTVYNLSGVNVENYLVATANDFIRNRYGGFAFGMPLPPDLQMDITAVPNNRTLSKVWFNPEGYHTMPAYLNSLSNLILRSNLPADKEPQKYAISVSSHPYFGRADDEDAIVQGMLQIIVAMCVLTGYSITTASFAIYEVQEHHSGSKRLQHIAGISEPFYWAVNFFYDMVVYLIPVTLTVGVIAAFQIPAFTDRQNLGAITLLLLMFGFATFPWMYLLAGVFKDAEMAFLTYVCINLFITINTIMSTSILYFMGQISNHNPEIIQDIYHSLNHIFLIFPQFNFGNGLLQLARMNVEVQILSGYGVDAYRDPFSMDVVGRMLLSSFIQGVVFLTLRLLLNKFIMRGVRRLFCRPKAMPHVACNDEDEDVVAEHLRVSSGAANSDILQVNQLTKVYQRFKRKVPAVKRLSVGIPAGECFGLLGENGAGKTTTFKMLTGDVSPTDGTAQIRDRDGRLVDIMECRNKGINIGYCPQVDALDSLLTGEEHLYFYARIRGISKRQIDGLVNYLLKRLELNYHRKIITDSYSCGTRRKLSTALALIGHPQILLLDEPSSGMDPRTKRHLWKIISEEVKGKCAVVLTSHSMEECEALCSRLAIMVKGQFRCLGSLQHIKNRFGSGFTVKMYLAEASCDAEAITGFMQRKFPSTYLKDQHSSMVEYHVPFAPGGVADIFDQLESNKIALQIKHFSVSQTTLDEVFINFAMGKIGMDTIPVDDEDDGLDSIKAVQT